MVSEIKRSAYRFLREHKVRHLTLERLREIIRSQGYKIIRYGKAYNEENVQILIDGLGLDGYVSSYSAFTYTDERYRLVFLEDNISDKEALILLAHEEGHIYNGHFGRTAVAGSSIRDEQEANEFAQCILKPTRFGTIACFACEHKAVSVLAVFLAAAAVCAAIASPQLLSRSAAVSGTYYATPSGTKYHRSDCVVIKDKTTKKAVTENDIRKRHLQPCKLCLPELN